MTTSFLRIFYFYIIMQISPLKPQSLGNEQWIRGMLIADHF